MMKKMVLAGFTAFIFIFIFDFLVHGFLLKGAYAATQSVWRPQDESNMMVMMLSQFLFAMAIAFLYPIIGPDKDCKKTIPFGLGLGLVMATPQISTYCYLPIPFSLSLAWVVATFVQVFVSVFIVGKIFNWGPKTV
jgi:hypothetical protein